MNALNALYSEALTSGLVLECGEGLSTCVPIVDGYVISQGIERLEVGGRDVNEYLMELLKPKVLFTTTFEREFVRDIKEQCCYIKPSGHSPGTMADKKRYQLPDGKLIDMMTEQHEAPEVLFNT
jgi:actin-related protein